MTFKLIIFLVYTSSFELFWKERIQDQILLCFGKLNHQIYIFQMMEHQIGVTYVFLRN